MVNQAKTKEPTVCAIMLVNEREEMVKRAIKSFREQTYQKKRLLILDTGSHGDDYCTDDTWYTWQPDFRGLTIGALRNAANWRAANHFEGPTDVLCHLDSDDWSHPRRIEEQVALLQASGKQCVGYKDMLFYDTTPGQFCGAWLYRHPTKPLGTSLMYWRSVWEQRPFPDAPKNSQSSGEDYLWLQGVDHAAASSFPSDPSAPDYPLVQPRMIASIHGENTARYNPTEMERQSEGTSWKRAAEWDEHCRKVMAP